MLRLQGWLRALPGPPPTEALQQRLEAEFSARFGGERRTVRGALGLWERVAGGARGWWWALAAVLLAALPAWAGELATHAGGEGLRCVLVELATGLLLGVGLWMVARGRGSRGAVVAASALGAALADAVLGMTCPAWFVPSHVLAFHVTGVVLAALAAGLLRPRRASA